MTSSELLSIDFLSFWLTLLRLLGCYQPSLSRPKQLCEGIWMIIKLLPLAALLVFSSLYSINVIETIQKRRTETVSQGDLLYVTSQAIIACFYPAFYLTQIIGLRNIERHLQVLNSFRSRYLLQRDKIAGVILGILVLVVYFTSCSVRLYLLFRPLKNLKSFNASSINVYQAFHSQSAWERYYFITSLLNLLGDFNLFAFHCFLITWCYSLGILFKRISGMAAVASHDKALRNFIEDHTLLSVTCLTMADEIGTCVLCCLGSTFLFALTSVGEIKSGIQSRNADIELSMQMEIVMVLLLCLLVISMVYVYDKAQDLGMVAQGRLLVYEAKEWQGLLFMTIYRLNSNPPGFSVAGIAVVNRPFIGAMVGLFATYILLTWEKT